jgi:hypothetical protein
MEKLTQEQHDLLKNIKGAILRLVEDINYEHGLGLNIDLTSFGLRVYSFNNIGEYVFNHQIWLLNRPIHYKVFMPELEALKTELRVVRISGAFRGWGLGQWSKTIQY